MTMMSPTPFPTPTMALRQQKTLTAASAAALDKELMSTGGFSLDQLMELAGLSVSQAIYKLHPPSHGRRILIACGPGNNGGDGLVTARHLHHYSYTPTIYYPKQPAHAHYQRLTTQLHALGVPFTTDFAAALAETDHVVDALFGFSFRAPVRPPFDTVLQLLAATSVPVTAVDVPSGWDVDAGGPPGEGPASAFRPAALVSLSVPKKAAGGFVGRHFVGGRFVPGEVARRFGVGLPEYWGVEQVVEVDGEGRRVEGGGVGS